MTEYAPNGLIGVLTPQANMTAEPELSILCPPSMGMLTARLTSEKASMDDRLVDYVLAMETSLTRLANAPLGALILPAKERPTWLIPKKRTGRMLRPKSAGAIRKLPRRMRLPMRLACWHHLALW